MEFVGQGSRRVLADVVRALALAACLSAPMARAEMPDIQRAAWKLESDAQPARYAVVEPSSTNLNVGVVVLACESARDRTVLQLQLYLTDDGPLLPKGADASRLKEDPRAEVEIDGKIFPVSLLFSDDHAVLADGEVEGLAAVSEPLVDAMAQGKTMTLRLDLLAEPQGAKPAFDGEAVIDLRAEGGSSAVETLRRCVSPMKDRTVDLTR